MKGSQNPYDGNKQGSQNPYGRKCRVVKTHKIAKTVTTKSEASTEPSAKPM